MSRFSGVCRRFLSDRSGIATAEWVAVTSMFVILGIVATYIVLGNDDEGLIAVVNSKQDQLADRVDDVDTMLTEVNTWSPDSE